MSWSASKLNGGEWQEQPQVGYGEAESKVAILAAKTAAEALAPIVGERVNIYLNGHANPNQTPTGGWATDALTINIQTAT
jgi:hypothetical protein